MAPIYEEVCAELGRPADAARLAEMQAANAKAVEELEAKIADQGGCLSGGGARCCGWVGPFGWVLSAEMGGLAAAAAAAQAACQQGWALPPLPPRRRRAEANAGEMEVRDALRAKADFLCGTGDHAAALAAYAAAEAKTAGVGPKMDLCFALIRCVGGWLAGWLCGGCWSACHRELAAAPRPARFSFPFPRAYMMCRVLPSRPRLELSRGDLAAVRAGLDKARGLCDKGGDWERKNKLKVRRAGWGGAVRHPPVGLGGCGGWLWRAGAPARPVHVR